MKDVLDPNLGDPPVHEGSEEVAHVQDADDLVERAAVHRVARVGRFHHRFERLLRRKVDRERHHLGPRHHHVGSLLVPEIEDLGDHLLLLLLDLAVPLRAVEEHPQLHLRVDVPVGPGRLHPHRPQDQLGGSLEDPDQRPEQQEEAAHRGRDREGHPLRVLERHALRDELADDHVEERDDQEGEEDREDRRDPGIEEILEDGLAQSADSQRGERDAQLHGGDEARRLRRDRENRARAAVALALQLANARAARGDEAVLGRDEEPVQQDQRRYGEQF